MRSAFRCHKSSTKTCLDVELGELGRHLGNLVLVDGVGLERTPVLLARRLQLHALDPVFSRCL